jgi:hypothetical protein
VFAGASLVIADGLGLAQRYRVELASVPWRIVATRDGARMAMISGRELAIVNSASGAIEGRFHADAPLGNVAWAHDGQRVIYAYDMTRRALRRSRVR